MGTGKGRKAVVVGVIAVGEVPSNFLSREEETSAHKERLLLSLIKERFI